MVKNEKFKCPSERGGPEDFKNHPTFVPSAIFWEVMASQTWGTFLGHPVFYQMEHTWCAPSRPKKSPGHKLRSQLMHALFH